MKLFNLSPESYAVVPLDLNADRILDDSNALLLLQIRTLPQDLVLEIRCELVHWYVLGFYHSLLGSARTDRAIMTPVWLLLREIVL